MLPISASITQGSALGLVDSDLHRTSPRLLPPASKHRSQHSSMYAQSNITFRCHCCHQTKLCSWNVSRHLLAVCNVLLLLFISPVNCRPYVTFHSMLRVRLSYVH